MTMALVYGFGSFVFFKVASAIFMTTGMNLALAALAGIGMFGVAFRLSRNTAVTLGKYSARSLSGSVKREEILLDLLVPGLAGWAALCAWVYLVSIGFDERFYNGLSGYYASREIVRSAIIIAVPVAIYTALSYWIVNGAIIAAQRRRG